MTQQQRAAVPEDVVQKPQTGRLVGSIGWLSWLTGFHMNRFISVSQRQDFGKEMVCDSEIFVDASYALFEKHWLEELKVEGSATRKPSLRRALWQSFRYELLKAAGLKLVWGFCMLLALAFFVRELLRAINRRSTGKGPLVGGAEVYSAQDTAWWLCSFFFVCNVIMSICMQQMQLLSVRLGLRIKAALSTAVYRKLLVYDRHQSDIDVVSLVSTDCQKVCDACASVQFLWSGIVEAFAIMGVLVGFAGVSALPGCAIMFLLLPLQYYIGIKITRVRAKVVEASETRVMLMDEVLRAIKLVKMYAWERKFADSVADLREQESKLSSTSGILKSLNMCIVYILPPLMGLTIFGVYEGTGNRLDGTLAFTTLSLFNTLRLPLFLLPRGLRGATEALTSIARLQSFLLCPDLAVTGISPKTEITFVNANLSYGASLEPLLKNVNLSLAPGTLALVAGPVGCGKSNFLQAVMGNMTCLKGEKRVGGKFAYVPQSPWCAHGTVRDNIIFGLPFDEKRYKKVLHACALERDLELMEEGDSTKIGERGMNLSGGQKQRIALARAAYSYADTVLLDAPLSAVDMYTCTHIFKHCIKGIFGENKATVVLVTHQVELFIHADTLIFMDEGNIVYTGPYDTFAIKKYFPDAEVETDDAKSHGEQNPEALKRQVSSGVARLQRQVSPDINTLQRVKEQLQRQVSTDSTRKISNVSVAVALEDLAAAQTFSRTASPNGKASQPPLKTVESDAPKSVPPKVGGTIWDNGYVALIINFRWYLVVISLLIFEGAQLIRLYGDIWVRTWVARPYKDVGENYYVTVFGCYAAGFLVALNLRDRFFFWMGLRAATRMHNRMFDAIVKAPMSYFTVTPLGHLLKTFSSDMDMCDEAMLDDCHMVVLDFCILATTFGVVIGVLPLFAAVLAVIMLAFFYYFFTFMKACNPLKDKAATGNAAAVASVSETLQGLDVILAYNAQPRFKIVNASLLDGAGLGVQNLELLSMWLAFRLDLIGSLLVLATTLLAVAITSITAADAGLAVSNAFLILIFFSLMVRTAGVVNSNIASVERVHKLGKVAPEADLPLTNETNPPAGWPSRGEVKFQSVVMTYAPGLPNVLKGVSFTIIGGEKVGVAGRTGAGKSTLIMAIFRLAYVSEGTVSLDGENIDRFNLGAMRKRIAIIPQEPVMFKGSLRSNLDPFMEKTDEDVRQALRSCLLPGFENSLDMPVLPMGTNFSLGQQQLICLARAMLNVSKLLLLDEATAALDSATDAAVQHILRANFADRTMITIAHRLGTIIDSDKILVMDAGLVAEFDSPLALLSRKSIFAELCKQTGAQYESLIQTAKAHHETKFASV
jgi:ABC-type multidrug transport system fused ATPase/permease subunit